MFELLAFVFLIGMIAVVFGAMFLVLGVVKFTLKIVLLPLKLLFVPIMAIVGIAIVASLAAALIPLLLVAGLFAIPIAIVAAVT